ncbi:hypothetical protein LSTR_LSTR015571 [Laodelphax striatellus]|uniref:Uncharacterized protein n=1 Tax=Laodelphax striatellus TaxID=195883 RepID=A0A482WIM1_LAOST|nr:hypothetical protein LSTR_LSTR015571 [Laodelphax striatellus]
MEKKKCAREMMQNRPDNQLASCRMITDGSPLCKKRHTQMRDEKEKRGEGVGGEEGGGGGVGGEEEMGKGFHVSIIAVTPLEGVAVSYTCLCKRWPLSKTVTVTDSVVRNKVCLEGRSDGA